LPFKKRGTLAVAKKSRAAGASPGEGQNKLDWHNFNFLENLLIFCAERTRSAPKESGVHFQISSKVKEEAVCILFKIDRAHDPLMPVVGVKPDYMVLYAARDRCICTIIEMKGKDHKNLSHGIEQIKALRDRLRREISEHLPHPCKQTITFQGILLTPIGSQLPLHQLQRESDAGLRILPIQYHQKAELYPYVSRMNALSDKKYVHQSFPRAQDELNLIEKALVCAEKKPIQDDFRTARLASVHRGRRGIYVNYRRPGGTDTEYASLSAANDGAVAAFSSPVFKREIKAELDRLGLLYKRLELR
jgi:hypothetical protein